MTRTWSKLLAVSAVLLGVGYAAAGASVWMVFHDAVAGLVVGGLGVLLAALGVGVWHGRAGAKAGATAAGFLGTALFGAMAIGAERDPDASDLVNNVGAATILGLACLSALVLAAAVTLAVVELREARRQRATAGS